MSFDLYTDESTAVKALLEALPWSDVTGKRTEKHAVAMVGKVRNAKQKAGELESFLRQYGLNTQEGLALMALAEALLRIPDAPTADALIEDKVLAAQWFDDLGKMDDWMVKAAGLGLAVTRRTLESVFGKLGKPTIRRAMKSAMRMMGRQFVLGRTIEEALKNSVPYRKAGYRPSYDMLGEGARTLDDAETYFTAYRTALETVGREIGQSDSNKPTLSVKLSALHPRYEYSQKERCVPALIEKLTALCRIAARYNIGLTVDAEEADRLALSLEIIESVIADRETAGWNRFGLAVQAYDKRCLALIDHLESLVRKYGRKINVRLVKGAYWDSEIKRAQVLGLADYPVFTRKSNTDLSWLTCAHKLLEKREWLYPMFATHNAHSMAAALEMAGTDKSGFEFQRLHGMGGALHDILLEEGLAAGGIYAPVGPHQDLLPYLVRRLLENGANSSFVNQLYDPDITPEELLADPVVRVKERTDVQHAHPQIPLSQEIYKERKNSHGLDLRDETMVKTLLKQIENETQGRNFEAAPLIAGKAEGEGSPENILNPANTERIIGRVWNAVPKQITQAFDVAQTGFQNWQCTSVHVRANALEKLAELLEEDRALLMGLLIKEAGKTLPDALAELREAVDFCRYYALRGQADFDESSTKMDGPTGEENILGLHGRGVFVCISPWNFPLAIYLGQITAALMAGNAVIAKPAEQTPLIAMAVARLIHKAGVPPEAFTLLPGAGDVGAQIVEHKAVAGVAFTGSTDVACLINRALAAKDGPIVPLIAETGGQNAMIVDSSALPEQVVDDVLLSAFGSAGQRCSALRVLYIQDDVADKIIEMLRGAMAEQRIGDPAVLSTDIGPVIDGEALEILEKHREYLKEIGTFIAEVNPPHPNPLPAEGGDSLCGHFFPPCAYEIQSITQLEQEIFGPILHVIRYKASETDKIMDEITATGYGLTFGIHSRIDGVMERLAQKAFAGNVYVNRSMTGAVVGCQPFGGCGLSGTGPKAGGPHYLPRFATEKVVSTDTTRQGGNATLVSLCE